MGVATLREANIYKQKVTFYDIWGRLVLKLYGPSVYLVACKVRAPRVPGASSYDTFTSKIKKHTWKNVSEYISEYVREYAREYISVYISEYTSA